MPQRIINSIAPIRICDNGGWTDTWFAGHGKVFNIGVSPYVEVQIAVYPRAACPDRIMTCSIIPPPARAALRGYAALRVR